MCRPKETPLLMSKGGAGLTDATSNSIRAGPVWQKHRLALKTERQAGINPEVTIPFYRHSSPDSPNESAQGPNQLILCEF